MTDSTDEPQIERRHRANDPSPVHITREIPLPWLIGIVVGLIVQGVTLYVGQQTQADAIRALAVDVKELRGAAAVAGLKNVEYGLRLDDHERRLQAYESRLGGAAPPPAANGNNGRGK